METKTFEGTIDRYNGVTIDSQEEPCGYSNFKDKLTGNIIAKLCNKLILFTQD